MKISFPTPLAFFACAAASLGASPTASAFLVAPPSASSSSFLRSRRPLHAKAKAAAVAPAVVELTPEPEGGFELESLSDIMPGSRMKCMCPAVIEGGPNDGKPADDGSFVFWLSAVADGDTVSRYRIQTEKEASKKANFPGFRKGQIPPYAKPKMVMFAIQETVIKTCEASLEAYGLERLDGSDGEVNVNEDMQKVCKGYKVGSDIAFTAKYRGKFVDATRGTELMRSSSSAGEKPAEAVDAEVVPVEADVEAVVEAEVEAATTENAEDEKVVPAEVVATSEE